MLHVLRRLAMVAAALVGLSSLANTTVLAQPSAAITTLNVEGRTSANPTIAISGNFVAVTWSAATVSEMDIFVATSRDGGTTFTSPTRVNSVAGQARVSGEEPPRVALVPRAGTSPEIVVVWTSRTGSDWSLLSSRSQDFGQTFSVARAVPGSEGKGTRGWQSVAVDTRGRVSVLWLDHRKTVGAASTHTHQSGAPATTQTPAAPKADPTERAKLSELYFAPLDGSRSVTVANSVCYCCKTSMAVAGDRVFAVWRHVFPGGERDIAFTTSSNGGKLFSAPQRVSNDRWKLDGCPDNGPALAVDGQRQVHVVWPTLAEGAGASDLAIFYTRSRDGQSFETRTRIPTGGPASHPQIVIDANGSPLIAWDEIVNGERRVGMARARRDVSGRVAFDRLEVPGTAVGQWYPALATSTAGTLAVWVRQLATGSTVAVWRVK